MKTQQEWYDWIEKEIASHESMDGFDMAYYDGMKGVLDGCGDGGISEQYIDGMRFMLDNLTLEIICGEWEGS